MASETSSRIWFYSVKAFSIMARASDLQMERFERLL